MSIVLKESYRNYDDFKDSTGMDLFDMIFTCIDFGFSSKVIRGKDFLVFRPDVNILHYVSLLFLNECLFGDFPRIKFPNEATFDYDWCNNSYNQYNREDNSLGKEDWDIGSDYGPNEKSSFVIRRKASSFTEEVDFDSIWDLLLKASEESISYPCITNKELYSVVYFLVCLRNEIIKSDYKKRGIKYNPLYSFDNYMYYTEEVQVSEWFLTNNIFSANILALKIDVVNFLLSSFVNRESGSSLFSFLNMTEDELWSLPGMQCLETNASKAVVLDLLVRIYNAVNLLCTLLLRTKPEPRKSVEGLRSDSIIPLMKEIFVKIQKMERFAMSF